MSRGDHKARLTDDLEEIIEHIPGVVFRLAHQGDNWKTLFVTENVSMFGYTREDFFANEKNWFNIIHPDDRIYVSNMVNEYELHHIDQFRMQYRLLTKNGDSVPVREYNTVNRDCNGRIICYDTVIFKTTPSETDQHLLAEYAQQQIVLNDILMSLHDSDLDHALQIILDRIGEYLNTSRVLLFQDDSDHKTCKVAYEWCNRDITSILGYSITYSTEMPEIYAALQNRGALLINYGEIPVNLREEFVCKDLVASAIFAVYLNGNHYGFVSFDDCVVKRVWDEDTALFLKNVSNLISTVLARQEAAKQLKLTQKTYETVLNNVDSYIFVTGLESGQIIFANQAFKHAFEENCEGQPVGKYLDIDLHKLRVAPSTVQANNLTGDYPEIRSIRTQEWLSVSAEVIPWVDGQLVRLINCYDVTAKKLYNDNVERLAFLDHLTGLPNRYRLDVDLNEELNSTRKDHKLACLLFIDMDDFKVVNDGYGHDYGDAVLISFADFLRELFPEPNKVFRWGGDEFVILISHRNYHLVEDYLSKLMARAQKPWQAIGKEFYCSLSIGVVEFPRPEDDLKNIIKHADIAMYEAKRAGKNNYAYYHISQAKDARQRSHMEELLRQSMAQGFAGFDVFYQPIVVAETGEAVGAEALLRMFDGDTIYLPGDFISLAEYLGLTVPIGEFVLDKAARQCRKINESGRPDFSMTVNLSAKQLNQPNILERLESILRESGAKPQNIIISISENTAVQDIEQVLHICGRLKELGIRLCMDDFGGGSSVIIRLPDMPVDIIKTSPIFMEKLDDQYAREFVDLIIKLSHSTHKRVCLSGVETEDQYRFCQSSSADLAQGFYFSQPQVWPD